MQKAGAHNPGLRVLTLGASAATAKNGPARAYAPTDCSACPTDVARHTGIACATCAVATASATTSRRSAIAANAPNAAATAATSSTTTTTATATTSRCLSHDANVRRHRDPHVRQHGCQRDPHGPCPAAHTLRERAPQLSCGSIDDHRDVQPLPRDHGRQRRDHRHRDHRDRHHHLMLLPYRFSLLWTLPLLVSPLRCVFRRVAIALGLSPVLPPKTLTGESFSQRQARQGYCSIRPTL